MNVFAFDAARYAPAYRDRGWALIEGGLSTAFYAYASELAASLLGDGAGSMDAFRFAGKKQQFLFEFPQDADYPDGVFDAVATVAGLPRERITLCERHIKAYEPAATAHPPPHKDRLASQVAVGIPLRAPSHSYVALYPHQLTQINPFNTTAELRESLDADALPERVLAGVEPVQVRARPGDVLIFRGSSIYHERIHPAGVVVLYLKFNAMRLDPIGEDARTPAQRARTLAAVGALSDEALLGSWAVVSPRLTRISRHYTRLYWKEVVQAYVGDGTTFTVSEDELRLVRALGDGCRVRDALDRLGASPPERPHYLPAVRRLARLQAIDLIPADSEQSWR